MGNPAVPARVGGVDLSVSSSPFSISMSRPRPCGRGGFKLLDCRLKPLHVRPRPCGRGGFKLCCIVVPLDDCGPRPCGRGGFKHLFGLFIRDGL